MPTSPQIAQIYLYPIKGLDGWQISKALITDGGSLQNDRRWAFFRTDQADAPPNKQVVNGKNEPRWLTIRSQYAQAGSAENLTDKQALQVEFKLDQQTYSVLLPDEAPRINQILSQYLGYPVQLKENQTTGFPDDQLATGPTLIGSATLAALSNYLKQASQSAESTQPDNTPRELFSSHDLFRRLRSNILLATDEALWEDCLFRHPEQAQAFRLGAIEMCGINPCKRCGVPARDPITGDISSIFVRTVMAWRQQFSPDQSTFQAWDNPYRLAVNTRIASHQAGKTLSVEDVLTQ